MKILFKILGAAIIFFGFVVGGSWLHNRSNFEFRSELERAESELGEIGILVRKNESVDIADPVTWFVPKLNGFEIAVHDPNHLGVWHGVFFDPKHKSEYSTLYITHCTESPPQVQQFEPNWDSNIAPFDALGRELYPERRYRLVDLRQRWFTSSLSRVAKKLCSVEERTYMENARSKLLPE